MRKAYKLLQADTIQMQTMPTVATMMTFVSCLHTADSRGKKAPPHQRNPRLMNAKTSCHPQLVGMLANLEPFGGLVGIHGNLAGRPAMRKVRKRRNLAH